MKKIKNLIGAIFCILLINSVGLSQASSNLKSNKSSDASAMFSSCNINAGGDDVHCFDVTTIGLYGSQSGIDISSISWTALSSNPASVTIANSASLITSFTALSGFTVGDYYFVISGTCNGTTNVKTDTVKISIKGATTVSQILSSSSVLLPDTISVCTFLSINGNTPGIGEVGVWSAPGGTTTFSQSGFTLTDSDLVTYNTNCLYRTYYYTISNGGCISRDTIVVKYERGASPNISPVSACGTSLTYSGSYLGCNSTASWVIIPPAGVAVPSSTLQLNNSRIRINFTVSGTYTMVYNVVSNGVCPGGTDTSTINICVSNLTSVPNPTVNEFSLVCDSFPTDTIWLNANVNPLFTYGNWYLRPNLASPAPIISQTGTGTAYALIYDQTVNQSLYQFEINLNGPPGDNCTFPDGTVYNCGNNNNYTKSVTFLLGPKFTYESDTLNVFCQNNNGFHLPMNYINTNYAFPFLLTAISVPASSTTIIPNDDYPSTTLLDLSSEGSYVFQTIMEFPYLGDTCRDTSQWVVNVATLQNPSAGSNANTTLCESDSVPLVGSLPIDVYGNPNPNAISLWTQIDGNPPVTFLGPSSNQTVEVTGFSVPGIYMFEYSFSRESNCYLADTMIIVVDSCTPCPDFKLLTCCDLLNSGKSTLPIIDPAIKTIIDSYKAGMKLKNSTSTSIDCCSPCDNPTDSFPVFVTDTANFLINPSLYVINWSHDNSYHGNHAFILPNQQTIVTVIGPDSCMWSDTFLLICCSDDASIQSFCAWDPCSNPTIPIPLNVQDVNGNLFGSGYTVTWSNGFTGNSTSSLLSSLPISVIVTDTLTGCIYYDTFDIPCPTPCLPVTPGKFGCETSKSGVQTLKWNTLPGFTYELEIIYNDPFCVRGSVGSTPIYVSVSVDSFNLNSSPASECVSWRVRAVCADGTVSAWSVKQCCCIPITPPCIIIAPSILSCSKVPGGKLLKWNSIASATSYEVEVYYNDPKCCKAGLSLGIITSPISTPINSLFVSGSSCFSWRVRSVCDNGTKSAWSDKSCSCAPVISNVCEPKIPTNLRCVKSTLGLSGQTLKWDLVPGATYEVEIYYGDPRCCKPMPGSITFPIATTTNSMYISSNKCFSWRVRSICNNETKSAWSDKECSCTGLILNLCQPKIPTNLRCVKSTLGLSGQTLKWDLVPGATYEVEIYYGDPRCCKPMPGSVTFPLATTTNSMYNGSNKCFSWRVRSICKDGTRSAWSDKGCSCTGLTIPKTKINVKSNNSAGSKQEIKVSTAPNPAKSFVAFNVTTSDAISELGEVIIINLTGQIVLTSQIKLNGSSVIDLSNLKAGTYIYKVKSEGAFKSGRVIKTD